ncbi:arylsulfotransferase family protein [Phaeacidiphilus oryzae]|uniref:arylsulfotransferase family protein n=1 Tax=Phaeacidiphilus oryzae TaxID=348818 RepID=UPI00055B0791|nr:arylsulfotransferase family protein [Phaeacidiphilus oryzae]
MRIHHRLLAATAAATATVAALAGSFLTAAPPAAAAGKPLPPVRVLTPATAGARSGGDLFLAPQSQSPDYASGLEILSPDGRRVVWSKTLPAGQAAADFRAQTYRGQRVLTWWQGTGLGGVSQGVDYVYDSHYRRIAEVRAGNGYQADGHEFLITPQNTALIIAYREETADLRSLGGPADQKVIDGVVQEIDIADGRVLHQWDAADHVPYSESEQPLPASAGTPWDWFHLNAVKLDDGGRRLLIGARNTWTTYQVDRRSGRIAWRLGGKDSSFTPRAADGQRLNQAGTIFAWQHDPEPQGGGRYTFFDNESAGAGNTGAGAVEELPYSRSVTVSLDYAARTATLVASNDQPAGGSASSQGDAQTLPGGDQVVGWGSLPYLSEFDRAGRLVFDAEFPAGVNSYRAYRFDWRG